LLHFPLGLKQNDPEPAQAMNREFDATDTGRHRDRPAWPAVSRTDTSSWQTDAWRS
jgi:hypothetical protein